MKDPNKRTRSSAQEGLVSQLYGEYRGSFVSGALTTVAAGTTTAGHVFSLRNTDATKKILLRYLSVDFNLTTAFGAGQAMGFDVIVATGYSASHTGGTAIDMGSTLPNSGKIRTNQTLSSIVANAARIGSTGALTAGTHVLHANPLNSARSTWAPSVRSSRRRCSTLAMTGRHGVRSRGPWEFGKDEGFIIRNTVLMGATGVGSLIVTMEWDEVTL
jgi:hypothetical protein